jgi:hypothetical protein
MAAGGHLGWPKLIATGTILFGDKQLFVNLQISEYFKKYVLQLSHKT